MSLKTRQKEPELMDQPDLDAQTHRKALSGLGRINWWSCSHSILWPPIQKLSETITDRPIRILDIASGGGDVVIRIAQKAAENNVKVEIDGCDISQVAVEFAQEQANKNNLSNVNFLNFDITKDKIEKSYDVIMCSLFLHHLDTEEAISLMKIMANATSQIILINDLLRTRFGYCLAWFGCHVLSRSPIVHSDGPLSVQGAFSSKEVEQLAEQAGLESIQMSYHWPQRFLLQWNRK